MVRKKRLLFCIVIFGCLAAAVMAAVPVVAKGDACGLAGYSDPMICGHGQGGNEETLQSMVRSVLEVVYLWVGIIAVIAIVIGGIHYMLSAGNTEKVMVARNTIKYALIGLVVTLAAFAVTEFVIGALEGKVPSGTAETTEEEASSGGGDVDPRKRPDEKGKWSVTTVTLSKKALDLVIGDLSKLSAVILPDTATDKTLYWASSDEKVADVDQEGNVSAKESGKTTITATSRNGVVGSTVVTVADSPEPALVVGKMTLLDEETTEAKVRNVKGGIKWESSDKKIFTVDENGKVKAKSPGAATIKATANGSDGKPVELSKDITVKEIKVLWVGESKTIGENVDKTFSSVARDRGFSIASTRVASSGMTLSENYAKQSKYMNYYYDYVVLQEQVDASINESAFYDGAAKIANVVKKNNARVKVYVRKTWYLKSNKSNVNEVATKVASRVAKGAGIWTGTINDGDALYAAEKQNLSVFKDEKQQNKLGAYAAATCAAATVLKVDPTAVAYVPEDFGVSQKNSVSAVRSIVKTHCYNK